MKYNNVIIENSVNVPYNYCSLQYYFSAKEEDIIVATFKAIGR